MATRDVAVKAWRAPLWRLERYLVTADSARVDSKEPTSWQRAFELTPWLQCEKMQPDHAMWIALLRLATVSSMPVIKPKMIEPAELEIVDEA